MKRLALSLFTILSFFCFSSRLDAQIITDRPDQTESSFVVGENNLQIETGVLIGFEGNPSARQLLLPTTLFRYGFNDLFELRFLSQFESQKIGDYKIQGISDIEIGTKIQLTKNPENNVDAALLAHFIVPIGSRELTNYEYGIASRLCLSTDYIGSTSFGINLGYNYYAEHDADFIYTIALGKTVNDKMAIYIEPYGAFSENKPHRAAFDAGLAYLINETLQADFSFGAGMNYRMNYISLGASWLILGDTY